MTPPPAGRPRKTPKAPRVTLAVRVDPEEYRLLMAARKRTKPPTSAGAILGALIRKHLSTPTEPAMNTDIRHAPTHCASGTVIVKGSPERFCGEDLARILRRAAILAMQPGITDTPTLLAVAATQLRMESRV